MIEIVAGILGVFVVLSLQYLFYKRDKRIIANLAPYAFLGLFFVAVFFLHDRNFIAILVALGVVGTVHIAIRLSWSKPDKR